MNTDDRAVTVLETLKILEANLCVGDIALRENEEDWLTIDDGSDLLLPLLDVVEGGSLVDRDADHEAMSALILHLAVCLVVVVTGGIVELDVYHSMVDCLDTL